MITSRAPLQRGDLFQLQCVTVNATSWGSMKKYLQSTSAQVVLGIEMHTVGDQTAEASLWAKRHGWKSLWVDALPGASQSFSVGGVAIFVRAYLGLGPPPNTNQGSFKIVDGRVAAALVNVPGTHGFVAYAAYFHDSEGLSRRNLAILQCIGEHVAAHGRPFICGADFNFDPKVLTSIDFAQKLSAQVVHSDTTLGTCTQGAMPTTLDYFVVSNDMAQGIAAVDVDVNADTSPHRPVRLTFHPSLTSLQALSFLKPPAIPVSAPIRPRPPPQDWSAAAAAAGQALHAARHGDAQQADQALFWAYKVWAQTAESELLNVMGLEVKRSGIRGNMPKLVWKSILSQESSNFPKGNALSKSWRWIAGRVRELRLTSVRHHGSKGVYGGQQVAAVASAIAVSVSEYAVDDADVGRKLSKLRQMAEQIWGHLGQWVQNSESIAALIDDMAVLQDEATSLASAEEVAVRKAAQAGWKDWVNESLLRGAGAVHKWSKVPVAWRPTTTLMQDGIVTADPRQLLQAEKREWSSTWSANEAAPKLVAGNRDALPRLQPQYLRATSLAFNIRSAQSTDGFHMRHYALLDDEGLSALAIILEAIESIGWLPPQLRLVLVLLIEKATGGLRPIGIFVSLYRLWGKARRPICDKWEAGNDRIYFAAGKGRSASDAVWRQAVKAEAGCQNGEQAAAFLWDVSNFYEMFRFSVVRERAVQVVFSAVLTKVALSAYQCARHLAYAGMIVEALFASNGIIAGCHMATTIVKVYTITPFDKVCSVCPTVDFDFYIDDLTGSRSGSAQVVENALGEAATVLRAAVEGELHASLAMHKAAVVASSGQLAAKLRAKMGQLGGSPVSSAKNLGIDFAAGRARVAHGRMSARAKRLVQANLRRSKLWRLAKTVGWRAKLIFTSGVMPATIYGAEVNGLSESELVSLQRVAASAMRPTAGGRSLSTTLLLNGDVTWKATAAPIVRWAKEVWNASITSQPRGFTLPELNRLWSQARPLQIRFWRSCRGPVAACFLSLKRLGWQWTGPFTILTDLCDELVLTDRAPAQIMQDIKEGATRMLERAVASRSRDPLLVGRRAFVGPVQRLLKPDCEELDAMGKGVLRSVHCCAVWPQVRLHESGYEVSRLCPLCGIEEDTIHHRVWWCSKSAGARLRWASPALVREARAAGTGSALFNRAIGAHPAEDEFRPRPLVEGGVNFESEDPELLQLQGMRGDIYMDGSCSTDDVPELRRAGWGVIMLGDSGEVVARAYGPVQRSLPQTPQSAEFCAYVAATELLIGPGTLHGDCSNVVRAANLPKLQALSWRRPHAAIFKSIYKYEGRRHVQGVTKVKAHVAEESVADPVLKRHAKGNNAAVEAANRGRLEHPVFSYNDGSVGAYSRKLRSVALTIANTCRLWPNSTVSNGKLHRRPVAVRMRTTVASLQAVARSSHVTHESHYRCQMGELVFCGICGVRAPSALAKPCKRRLVSAKARRQLESLMQGRDPATGRSILVWRDTGEEGR